MLVFSLEMFPVDIFDTNSTNPHSNLPVGFTELCEKYTKTGVSGPSRMTQVLNKYLGSMVQEVLSHNGDVLKFSGDAFLAMYKITESETIRDCVHEALDSALVIQKNYGSYLTDVGVVIRGNFQKTSYLAIIPGWL